MIALVLGVVVILSSGAAILATSVIQHDPLVQKDVVEHYAYRAVESGFDSFLSTVNANPNEMNCTATSTDLGECPGTRYKAWRKVTGTTGGAGVVPEDFWWTNPRFCYTPACSKSAPETTGLIYVKVAIWGRAGFFSSDYVYQKITADLESENGFLTHVWWSDYEATDPHNTTHTTSACTYDWNNTYNGPIAPLPTITSVTPTQGPTTGGTRVTITGTHLSGATAVRFGTKTATTFTVTATTRTRITATTPAAPAGTDEVSVTAVGGTARRSTAFTFTALPTVTRVTPSSGPTTGGTLVTITGTNFSSKAASVTFGTTPATSVTVTSPTQMKATSPAAAGAGPVSVSVTNLGGTGTEPTAFTYVAAPAVTSVTPSSGPTSGGTTVTITGTDFSAATAAVKFGSTAAASFTVTSPTTIKAVTKPHAAGTVGVSVTTASGAAGKTTVFTFTAVPTLGTLAPTSGPQGGGTRVVISGTNFSARTASVTFGTVPATTVTVTSSTRMTAKTPAHATGTVGVTVTNLGGSATKAAAYTYNAAGTAVTVTSVTPDHAPATTFVRTTVTIHGTHFPTSGTKPTVKFGTTAVTGRGVTVTSSTTITVRPHRKGAGTVSVSVGTATEPTAFTYVVAPTVSSVTPNYGPTGGGTVVTVAGTHFTGATAVTFGGTPATTVAVTSAAKITARTPAHSVGVVTVSVTASGETGKDSSTAFDYQHPTSAGAVTVTRVSPRTGHGGTTVTITGSGFATPSTVRFGTISATTVTVTSPTRISATAPLENGGTVSVSVTDAAGTGTDPTAFTYTNTGACSPVYFGPPTKVYGPIFSNDSFYVTTSTVPKHLGPIETHDPKCVAVTGPPGGCVPSATSVTGTADKHSVAYEPIPRSDSALATYAAEHLPTARGCLYHGPTTIEFDTLDTMTVWSPDSTPTSTCLPSQGATVDVPNGGHPTTKGNGVVYVATETTTAKCMLGANPFDNLVTGGKSTKSQLGHYDRIGSTTPNCEADAFVSDAPASTSPPPTPTHPTTLAGISGQLTVGSSANIVVTGNIEYTHCGGAFKSTVDYPCTYHPAGVKTPTHPTVTEPNDVLGLIANDYVEVNRPVPTSITGCTAAVTGRPGAAVCEPGPLTIDAAILALQHSFAVNNFTATPAIGTLTVYGTIDQKWRGAVGKTTGRGYTKDYDWDSRVTAVTPPHYLNPSTPSWALASSAVSSEGAGPT
jgi:hypothetical protein